MKEPLHPEIQRLVKLVGEILPLVGIGRGATSSFWKERSIDCYFLEFGKEFQHWEEPRVRVQFYPGQTESVAGIDHIEIIATDEIWKVDLSFQQISHLTKGKRRVQHTWEIRTKKDSQAHLRHFSITDPSGNGVHYASFLPQSDDWSHATTSGYPWTWRTPKTLKIGNGRLISKILGKTIVPHVSIKRTITSIIKLGKFEEFKRQLLEREPRFHKLAA